MRRARFATVALAAMALAATGARCGRGRGPTDPALLARSRSFADHTVPRLRDEADFARLARTDGALPAVKFIVTRFDDPAESALRFYDSTFFAMHDEWYWFRLANGALVDGDDTAPLEGHAFDTVASVYAWTRGERELPLGLARLEDGRVYAQRFYDQCFGPARRFGVGTLVRLPPSAPARWAFELEYGDEPTSAQLTRMFSLLRAGLGEALAGDLRFIARSPAQEALIDRARREGHPERDRLLRYADLAAPARASILHPGIAAGPIVRVLPERAPPALDGTQIVLHADPDAHLTPDAAAVLFDRAPSDLSRIRAIARERGTPLAVVEGINDSPHPWQLARGYANALVLVEPPSTVRVLGLDPEQFQRFTTLSEAPLTVVLPALGSRTPFALPLASGGSATTADPRALGAIGAAMSAMADPFDPPRVLVTARGFVQHLAAITEGLGAPAALAALDDARARALLLEGHARFFADHPEDADRTRAMEALSAGLDDSALRALARGDGVRGAVARAPVAAEILDAVDTTLREAFASLSVPIALEIRGGSASGLIDASLGACLREGPRWSFDPREPRATRLRAMSSALAHGWSCALGSDAFETLRRARLDPLSASVTLLVGPATPSDPAPLEGAFSIEPPEAPHAAQLTLTRPDGARWDLFAPRAGGEVRVARSPGTLAGITEEDARALFARLQTGAVRWLDGLHEGVSPARRTRAASFALSLARAPEGWPQRIDGRRDPARWTLVRAVPIERPVHLSTEDSTRWPLPGEVYAALARVERWRCEAELSVGAVTIERTRAWTDPALPFGARWSASPFEAAVSLRWSDPRAMGVGARRDTRLDHTELRPVARAGGVSLRPTRAEDVGFDQLELGEDGGVRVVRGAVMREGRGRCARETQYSSPEEYLRSIVAERDRAR